MLFVLERSWRKVRKRRRHIERRGVNFPARVKVACEVTLALHLYVVLTICALKIVSLLLVDSTFTLLFLLSQRQRQKSGAESPKLHDKHKIF